MGRHSAKARELFEGGYNCAQSVFAAFCDETGLDMETALKLSSSFGGGIGRLREVCGAVSGMLMAAGMKYGYAGAQDDDAKAEHYQRVQALAYRFKDIRGSYICRELLGLDGPDDPRPSPRTQDYYKTRICGDCVACAAEILDEYIHKKTLEG